MSETKVWTAAALSVGKGFKVDLVAVILLLMASAVEQPQMVESK